MAGASLITRLLDEADQCRQDGANDIAKLLDEAACALQKLGIPAAGLNQVELGDEGDPMVVGGNIASSLAIPALGLVSSDLPLELRAKIYAGAVAALMCAMVDEFGRPLALSLIGITTRDFAREPGYNGKAEALQ